jgi:hypothetical protein
MFPFAGRFQGDADNDEWILAAMVNQLNLQPSEAILMFVHMCPKVSREPECLAQAGAAFYSTLHNSIDQWIASGRSGGGQGVESVADRSVRVVPFGYYRPLGDFLDEWLSRNTLPQTVNENGQRTTPRPFVDFRRLRTAPAEVGQNYAVWWFLHLMGSPSRYRLAHCMNSECGDYFAYERTPRRLIKRGTFCPDCKGRGAALRRDRSREERTRVIVEAAANAWDKWKWSRRHPDRRAWVAQRVGELTGIEIERRWISRNLDVILKRVEGQRNAKG